MSAPPTLCAAQPSDEAVAQLPAVHRPGTHATPEGRVEVSTATFCDAVFERIPDSALLFRMGEVVGRLSGSPGARRFLPLDVDTTRLLVDGHVRIVSSYEGPQGTGIRVDYVPCGKDLAGLVLAAARTSPRVRPLRAVVNYPVYVPGFVLAAAGYNAGVGVFYDEPDDLRELPPSPENPFAVLDDLLAGFPFLEEASRENAIALLLTLVVRFAVQSHIPGFLVRAHRERTGKTLLVRTLCVAARGEEPSLLQLGSTEEEREKRITSELLRARTLVVFDNLPAGAEIDSPALAMLLTTRTWTGRVLGRSHTPALPNEMTVVLTGNNVGATGEVAQRLVPIHLAATCANPQDRTGFPHADPVAFARSRRRAVLGAVLGMVERWKSLDSPPFEGVAFGGFEAWTRAVGGVLATSGSRQFLANLRSWQDAADEFAADRAVLLADWTREAMLGPGVTESLPVRAKAIYERAERLDLFARFRQGATEAARSATFGKRVLGVLVDQIVEVHVDRGEEKVKLEVRLRRATSGSASLYRLEVVR